MRIFSSRTGVAEGGVTIRACAAASRRQWTPKLSQLLRTITADSRVIRSSDCASRSHGNSPGEKDDPTGRFPKGHAGWRRDVEWRPLKARMSLPCSHDDDILTHGIWAGEPAESPWDMELSVRGAMAVLWSVCCNQAQARRHQRNGSLRAAYLDELHRFYQLPQPPAACPSTVADHNNREMAQIAEEYERHGRRRNPETPTQLERAAESVLEMIDLLMKQAYVQRFDGDEVAIRAEMAAPESAWNMIRMVRSEGYPRYYNSVHEPEAAAQVVQRANEISRRVFSDWALAVQAEQARTVLLPSETAAADHEARMPRKAGTSAMLMLSKICFNLHVQKFLPDIHTYNMLLLGFIAVGEPHLANIVADSILYKTKFLPTKQTVLTLLWHYQLCGDVSSFYHTIRRMIGKDSSGLNIRRMSVRDASRDRNRDWAVQDIVAVYKNYCVEMWIPDAEVLEALTKGLISFDQAQHAAQVLALSLRSDFAVSSQTLVELLDLIVSTFDFRAASVLLRGLCASLSDTTSLLMSDDCPEVVPARLRTVLDLYAAHLSLKPKSAALAPPPGGRDVRWESRLSLFLMEPRPLRHVRQDDDNVDDISEFETLAIALWIRETAGHMHAVESVTDGIVEHLIAGDIERACQRGVDGLARLRSEADVSRELKERWLKAARFHILRSRADDLREAQDDATRAFLAIVGPLIPATLRSYILSPGFPVSKQLQVYFNRYARDMAARLYFKTQFLKRGEVITEHMLKRVLAGPLGPAEQRKVREDNGGTWRNLPIDVLERELLRRKQSGMLHGDDGNDDLVDPTRDPFWD